MKKITRSALGRTLDPRYRTNLAILLLAALAGGLIGLVSLAGGSGFLDAVVDGFYTGLAVFFGWAFSREIDPDHEYSAFFSAALGFVFSWLYGPASFLGLVLVLLLLRVINRSTGYTASLLDLVLVSGLTLLLVVQGNWIFGLLGALALLLDGLLRPPNRRSLLFAGILSLAALGYLQVFPSVVNFSQSFTQDSWILLVSAVLLVPMLVASRHISSMCDFTDESINPQRIQAAQVFAWLSALAAWLVTGSLMMISPLIAALLGTSIYYLFTRLYNRLT